MDDPRLTGPQVPGPGGAAEQRRCGDLSPADTPRELLDAALRYAARGWPVFLCKPGSKEPLTLPAGDSGAVSLPVWRQRRAWREQRQDWAALAAGLDHLDSRSLWACW
jgi:bifunctional DNA primase/polymerase-like protein